MAVQPMRGPSSTKCTSWHCPRFYYPGDHGYPPHSCLDQATAQQAAAAPTEALVSYELMNRLPTLSCSHNISRALAGAQAQAIMPSKLGGPPRHTSPDNTGCCRTAEGQQVQRPPLIANKGEEPQNSTSSSQHIPDNGQDAPTQGSPSHIPDKGYSGQTATPAQEPHNSTREPQLHPKQDHNSANNMQRTSKCSWLLRGSTGMGRPSGPGGAFRAGFWYMFCISRVGLMVGRLCRREHRSPCRHAPAGPGF